MAIQSSYCADYRLNGFDAKPNLTFLNLANLTGCFCSKLVIETVIHNDDSEACYTHGCHLILAKVNVKTNIKVYILNVVIVTL